MTFSLSEKFVTINFISDRFFEKIDTSIIDITLTINRMKNEYSINITKELFINKSFSFKLEDAEGNNLFFDYGFNEKTLSMSYEKNKDIVDHTQRKKFIEYEIGKKFIVKIKIKNVLNFLKIKSPQLVSCSRYILDESEKETIEFYYDQLEKFEQINPGIREPRALLKHVLDDYPICSVTILDRIIHFLRGLDFLEVELCIANLEEIEKRKVLFEPVVIDDKKEEKFMEDYLYDYRFNKNAISSYTSDDIHRINTIGINEIKKIPNKLGKVKKLLVIKEKHSPPKIQMEIRNNITVIENYEKELIYVHNYKDNINLLDKLLDILDSVSYFFKGLPQIVFSGAISLIRGIKALKDLTDKYERDKKMEETRRLERNGEIVQEHRPIGSIRREALRRVETAIPGRKAGFIVNSISRNGGVSTTYGEITHSLRGQVSESWVREVVQRIDGYVLGIHYNSKPHIINIYSLNERDFWTRLNMSFGHR